MRYTVRVSYVDVLGYIWMPHALCSMRYTLSGYDLAVICAAGEEDVITRDGLAQWLTSHTGDFSQIIDFRASIEYGDRTLDFNWSSEENEVRYLDTIATEDY